MKYYVLKDGEKEGPFDFFAMIKKINKGEITESTLVFKEENDEQIPAEEIQEFESALAGSHNEENIEMTGLDISQAMKNSKFFVLENITTVPMTTGIFLLFMVLAILMGNAMLAELGAIIGVAISYVILGVYSVYIVQKTQGIVEPEEIVNSAKSGLMQLFLVGIVFAVPPVLMISALISVTGNYAIICFTVALIVLIELIISTFVPFLIIEKKKNLLDAFKLSMEATASLKKSDLIRVFFVNLFLVLATFAIGLPLLFVLPFAFATFAEIYQELFLDID